MGLRQGDDGAALLAIHDQWVVCFNYQSHWAHRERDDDRRSPRDVLGWVSGRTIAPEDLHRAFYRTLRQEAEPDARGPPGQHAFPALAGCPLGRYGEHELSKEHAAVWLYGEALTIALADEPLARYRVRYRPDKKYLRAVEEPQVYETPFRSSQMALRERDDTEWLKVIRRPDNAPRQARQELPRQASLSL